MPFTFHENEPNKYTDCGGFERSFIEAASNSSKGQIIKTVIAASVVAAVSNGQITFDVCSTPYPSSSRNYSLFQALTFDLRMFFLQPSRSSCPPILKSGFMFHIRNILLQFCILGALLSCLCSWLNRQDLLEGPICEQYSSFYFIKFISISRQSYT